MNIQSASYSSQTRSSQISGSSAQEKDTKDGILESLKSQIAHVTEQLQSLSENKNMSLEEKMDRRKQLQEQLATLKSQVIQRNVQIQQEKIEKRNREMEAQAEEKAATKESTSKTEGRFDTIDIAEMKDLVSAQNTMSQVYTAEGVKVSLEGRAGVLAIEIKTDAARGVPVLGKAIELSEITAKITSIETANAGRMAEANEVSEVSPAPEKELDSSENVESEEEKDESSLLPEGEEKEAEKKEKADQGKEEPTT